MASWSFFEGKTVDAAIQNACKELGVTTEKLKYEIEFSGSSGIFGLVGAKNAKIRVKKPENAEVTAAEKERQEILSLVDETFADADTNNPEEADEPPAPAKPDALDPEPDALDREPERTLTEADLEVGKIALSKIIDCIGTEATVSFRLQNQQAFFNIEGDNAAILIGKHGQTLKAMQHIVEKIIHKSCGERARVSVDVEKYMEKRKASLKSLAARMADKVKQTGKPTTINRMDAYERKIIHDALRKNKNVKTRSTGGGEVRNIVIHPGKKTWRGKKGGEK